MFQFATPLAYAARSSDRMHDRKLLAAVLAVVAILAGIAFANIVLLFQDYSHHPNLLRVFFTALCLSAVLTAITVLFLRWLDRRDPLPGQVYVGLLCWGAVLSIGLAIPINQRVLDWVDRWVERNNWIPCAGDNRGFLLGAPIAGPFVEETLKGLGVLLVFIFFRSFFRSPRDGFIMGALVGAGFNFFESGLYVANDYAQWGIHAYGTELGGRWALFGFASHALYTGLTGLGLGYAAQSKSRGRAILWGLTGYLLAVIAHLVNNGLGVAVVVVLHTLNQPLPDLSAPTSVEPFLSAWTTASFRSLVIFLPSLLLVLITLRRTGKWEQATIRSQLADEPATVVTDQERAQIDKETGFRTRKYKWEPRSSAKKLIAEQNKLAFLKYQVGREGGDPATDPQVAQLRDQIERLRAVS